jgi:hypothetical protein
MRIFSANVTQVLALDNLSGFSLVEVYRPGGTTYETTLPYDLYVAGLGATYLHDSNLIGIDAPRTSTSVDREVYKLTYLDPQFTWRALFESGAVGIKVRVFIGFINTSTGTIGGFAPGEAMNNYNADPAQSDILLAYQGVIDSHGYNTRDDSEVTVALECSSPMAALGMTRSFMTSQDAAKKRNAADTAFDQVHLGGTVTNYLWGKA